MPIDQLKRKKVCVIGDFMLDVYTIGEVKRISPEAPVPVLQVKNESRRAGGAGNTILNLVSLGMDVVAIGRVGEDAGGRYFLNEMAHENVDTRGIFVDPSFKTPLKNRMIADNQQIVRVDYEDPKIIDAEFEEKIIKNLSSLLQGMDVIAISDYAKGLLTPSLLNHVIHFAHSQSIPLIVDPKGMDFKRYRGATVIKPNYSEAVAAAGLGLEATLEDIAAKLLDECALEYLMVTRSKEGISLFHKNSRFDFPARIHEVRDVTGAGDTVLALIAAALANKIDLSQAAELANIAAGIAIERIGCARISLADLSERLLELKCNI